MSIAWRAGLVVLATSLLSCGSDSSGPGATDPLPASVLVTPDSALVPQLGTLQLTISVFDEHGIRLTGVPLVVTSEDTLLVRATTTGLLSSVGPAGVTGVRVQAGAVSRRIGVEVKPAPTTLTLTPGQSTMPQFQSVLLTAVVMDKTGAPIPGATVTFLSKDPSVATVSGTGLVTSAGPSGLARIEARTGNLSVTAQVTVSQVPTTLVAAPLPMTLGAGRAGQISVTVLDLVDDVIPGAVPTYVSDNPSVAAVSPSGSVSSSGTLGSANIAVEALGLSDTLPVVVVANNHLQGLLDATTPSQGVALYSVAVAPGGLVFAGALTGAVFRSSVVDHTVAQVRSGGGELLFGMAFDPAGAIAYAAGLPVDGGSALDSATGNVVASVGGLTGTPLYVLAPDDGQDVYISTDGALYRLDPADLSVVSQVTSGAYALHLAVHPTQPLLYVDDQLHDRLLEVDRTSLATVRTFMNLGAIQGLGVAPDGAVLYSADESGSLRVTNLASGVQNRYPLPCQPWGLAVALDGTEVYLGCGQAKVLVFDAALTQVTATISLGGTPHRLALSPDGSVLVAAVGDGSLVFIR